VKLLLVYHLVDLPGWEAIAERQIRTLRDSGLLDGLAEAHFLAHYQERSFSEFRTRDLGRANVRWVFDGSVEPREAEVPSVAYLQALARAQEGEAAIAYLHMKGITKLADEGIQDWTRFMEYTILERWRDCVARLDAGFDTCGVSFRLKPYLMYAGNFWWTRASYARRLVSLRHPRECGFATQVPTSTWGPRFDAEAWLLSGTGRHVSLDSSPVVYRPSFHYKYAFPPDAYRGRHAPEFAFSTRGGRLAFPSRVRFTLGKRLGTFTRRPSREDEPRDAPPG
jgi:hypothetical protein